MEEGNNYNNDGACLADVRARKLDELAIELFGNWMQMCSVNWMVKLETRCLAKLCNGMITQVINNQRRIKQKPVESRIRNKFKTIVVYSK